MGSKVALAEELAQMIKEANVTTRDGKERIPNSETHLREWSSHFAIEESKIRSMLLDLKTSHYIFHINIILPDQNLFLPGTDSYVYAELSLLNDLKRYTELKLEKTYEQTIYKKKSPFQIIKELFPKVKEYNNTPLGKALNEAVMIDEFTRVMTTSAFEYTDQWKKGKLREIYSESEDDVPQLETELENRTRAVDHIIPKTNTNSNSAWNKMTDNFPIEFILRIHFRRYEFETVKKLISTGKIRSENDLRYVRDTLQLMEGRTNQDIILKRHLTDMIDLRRLAQGKLNQIRSKLSPGKN